jgi:AcrR family transcriptional regulator
MVRPRSSEAHQKVLEAALALYSERGIDATSMDAIAETSGVSKATIYKHWPDKTALTLEVLSFAFGLYEERPEFNSGDLRRDLIDALSYQPKGAREELKNRLMPHVIAYAARDREFGDKWRTRVIAAPQERLKEILGRGLKQKQIVNVDTGVALALLLGPMLYQHIFIGGKSQSEEARKIAGKLAVKVVDTFWKAHGKK